jgi:cytosine/adenosine deaminase-related metal-dependent hydrolase
LTGPGFLAVHVNYLWDDDARLLGESGSHVVHCPRSHAYFKHQRFPASELAQAGVRACLGTDSLASTRPTGGGAPPVLSMFDEMAAFMAHDSTVSAAEVLAMATVRGAAAMGLSDGTGTVAAGAPADFCVIPDEGSAADVHEVIVGHAGYVSETWIAGVREASRA